MLNFDLNNDAVFADVTGNGAVVAVVAGRDHRCLPLRALKPSGKQLVTAYRSTTPAVTCHRERQDMLMSTSSPSWHRQQRPAAAPDASGHAVAPAIWASLIIQQAL